MSLGSLEDLLRLFTPESSTVLDPDIRVFSWILGRRLLLLLLLLDGVVLMLADGADADVVLFVGLVYLFLGKRFPLWKRLACRG